MMFKDIKENFDDLYTEVRRVVEESFRIQDDSDWMDLLQSKLRCVTYTSSDDIRSWRSSSTYREEAVAKFFVREVILTKLGLFEEVSFHYTFCVRTNFFIKNISGCH